MASLLDHWLGEAGGTRILDEASVSVIRTEVRTAGAAFDREFVERCAIIASELAQNQLRHAGGGLMRVDQIEREGVGGLEIIAADRGRGIPIDVFHRTERPSSGSLGAGLGAVQRLAHEVDFDIRAQEGTCVRARKFAGATRLRREIAIVGRPAEDSDISGDQAMFLRDAERLFACVIDGVGHGELAREASDVAVETICRGGAVEPIELLRAVEQKQHGGRGCVLSRVVLDEMRMSMSQFGIGNATVILTGPNSSKRFISVPGIVGQAVSKRRIHAEKADVQPGELIIMHTDGLTSQLKLSERPDLFYRPAIVVATYLLATFGRTNDDATVVVIK